MYALDLQHKTTRIVLVYASPEACVEAARPGCTIIQNIPDEECRGDGERLLKYIDNVPEEEKVKV